MITGATSLLCTQTDKERSHVSSVKLRKREKTACKRKGKLGGQFRKFAVSPAFVLVWVSSHRLTVCILSAKIFLLWLKS